MNSAFGCDMVKAIKEELASRGLPESLHAAVRLGVPIEWAEACSAGIKNYKDAVRYAIARQRERDEFDERAFQTARGRREQMRTHMPHARLR
jgi:hypothetical protein